MRQSSIWSEVSNTRAPSQLLGFSTGSKYNNQYAGQGAELQSNAVLRGCYWDGGAHSRNTCEQLEEAVERGDVHKKGPVLYLGREDSNTGIRVPIPVEHGGRIMWQKEWVSRGGIEEEGKPGISVKQNYYLGMGQ